MHTKSSHSTTASPRRRAPWLRYAGSVVLGLGLVIPNVVLVAQANEVVQQARAKIHLPVVLGKGPAGAPEPSPTDTTVTPTDTTATPTTATPTTATPTTVTPTDTTATPTTATPTTATPTDTTATPTDTTATPTDTTATPTTATPTTATPTTATPVPNACTPISTLGCTSVPVALPFALSWNGEAGGLRDKNGLGTGFTMADPPSTRLASDNPVFNAQVPGYEPSRLTVNTAQGTLTIRSTKGLQFSNPSVSSGTNSQINGLGVGFPAPGKFRITTTLVSPNLPGSSGNQTQQAGVWFGLNENNYAKVAIVKTGDTTAKVQLLVEAYGQSATGPAPVELSTADNAITNPETKTIVLHLELDKAGGTARGFYQIDGGSVLPVSQGQTTTRPVPAAFFTGRDHDSSAATPALSYGGIFTSHRNAAAGAAIDFAFADFAINAFDLQPPFATVSWAEGKPQPVSNSEGQSIVVGGKLYSFGGFDSQKGCCTPTDRSYVFDPALNSWSPIKPLPFIAGNGSTGGGATHAGIATDGTFIYLASGYIAASPGSGQVFGSQQAWRYNPANDTYQRLPDLPLERAGGMLAVVDGYLHYFGGTNRARTEDVADHWRLDLNGGTAWQVLAPLPNPRHHMGAVVYGGKIYVVGGQRRHDGALIPQDTMSVYDPARGRWDMVAPLPEGRNHTASTTVLYGDYIIVMGGQYFSGVTRDTVFAYHIPTNTWQSLTPLPGVRHSAVGGVIDGKLYFSTGSGGPNKTWVGTLTLGGGQ